MDSSTEIARRRRRSRHRPRGWRRYARRAVAAAAVLAVVLGGTWGVRGLVGLSRIFHTDPFHALMTLITGHGGSDVARAERDQRPVTVALYGYGGPGHSGAYLTDSIMVVTVQPSPSGPARIAEISIPRDWYVPIDLGAGQTAMGRVNEAYESGQIGAPFRSGVYTGDQGGGRLADATLERMLGLHIDYFVGIDFTAFKSAVDSVGGVDVNVPHAFTDSRYPAGECDGPHPNCAYMTVHFDAGPQHMNGARALIYARSRESSDPQEGSNFARNKRQQLVLGAVKQKVLSIGGLRNLPDLLGSLGDHVITDMPLDSALSLYDLVKDVDAKSIVHVSIDDTNLVHECGDCSASIEFPYDRTFATTHHLLANLFVPANALAENAAVTILDGSGRAAGASMRWTTILRPLGLSPTNGGRARFSPATHVIDLSGGSGGATASWLASFYGVQVEGTQSRAAAGLRSTTTGIVVILGGDEEAGFNAGPGLYQQ